jgi:hypothetical protein
MKPNTISRLFVLLIVFSLSCSTVSKLAAEGGPKNFTAVLTAPDVVLLSWDAVEGATGYILELSMDDGESIPIIGLPSEYTSYEDLSAPEKSKLTYQVQVMTESGPAGTSKVEIETGERKPNPLTVNPAYDEENAVAVTVGTQGGTVSLVDSNKVEYTLAIPDGALTVDTEIRMTAAAIQDWPLDGTAIGAVRLEPEGLLLNDVAILTIETPLDIDPDLAIVGFAFDADGQEFHLQPTDQEKRLTNNFPSEGGHLARAVFQQAKNIVRMPVMELKVGGIGQTDHKSVATFTKDHAPTDDGAALEQKWAADHTPGDPELAPLESFNSVREEAYQIGKAISNAKNCAELNSQIVLFQKWRFSGSYQGLSDDKRRDYTKFIWDELTDKVKEILEKAAEDCEKSSESGDSASPDSPCAKALLEKIINPPAGTVSDFNLELKNKLENKLSNDELQDIKDKLGKCKAAYRIVGGLQDWQTDTAVCDIMIPFKLTSPIITLYFSGGLSGTYQYAGGPYDAGGGRRYTILLPNGVGKPGTMTGSGEGCVETPLGPACTNATEKYDLTPLDPGAPCTQ